MKFKRLTAVLAAMVMSLSMVTAASAEDVSYDDSTAYAISDTENSTAAYAATSKLNQLLAEYPDGSYYSNTKKACTCHRSGYNPCDWDIDCDCINYDYSIQCVAFAKYVFYNLRGFKWANGQIVCTNVSNVTAEKAKSILKGTPAGTYVNGKQYGKGEHAISIVSTSDSGLYVYEANYEGHCRVRYKEWTWEEFANYMPYFYKVVK